MRFSTTKLRFVLLLSVAVALVSVNAKCSGGDKAQRFYDALVAGSALPAALSLPADQQKCWGAAFDSAEGAVASYQKNPTEANWALVTDAAANFDTASCVKDARIVAFVKAAQRILQSIQPAGTAAVEGGPLPKPDFGHVEEADLKELERLTKPNK